MTLLYFTRSIMQVKVKLDPVFPQPAVATSQQQWSLAVTWGIADRESSKVLAFSASGAVHCRGLGREAVSGDEARPTSEIIARCSRWQHPDLGRREQKSRVSHAIQLPTGAC